MRGQTIVIGVALLILAACVLPLGARDQASTSPVSPGLSPTPSSLERQTVRGRVVDVMVSARVLLVETDRGLMYLALVEGTHLVDVSGQPIALRDIVPVYVVEARGRMTKPNTINAEKARAVQ